MNLVRSNDAGHRRSNPQTRTAWRVAAALAILCMAAAAAVAGTSPDPAPIRGVLGPELVKNGSFEAGATGWRTNGGAETPLTVTSGGVQSDRRATITAHVSRNAVLNDQINTVRAAEPGTRYRLEAWVRSADRRTVEVRVREVGAERVVTHRRVGWLITDEWQRLNTEFVTSLRGATLDLNVLAYRVPAGGAIHIDRVSLREVRTDAGAGDESATPSTGPVSTTPTEVADDAAEPAVPEPSATAPITVPTRPVPRPTVPPSAAPAEPAPTPDDSETDRTRRLTNGCAVSERGIPECGTYFGASLGANDDPAWLEAKAGRQLGVRRTFWRADQVAAAVRTAGADLDAGRLPWISFKLPHTWEDMAAGRGDAWARDLARRLAGLDGPVWVAFHHEPEHDGDMAKCTAIQQRLAPIVRGTASNVGYSIILTGYHQVHGDTKRFGLDVIWPDTTIDVVGFDIYNTHGVPGAKRQTPTDFGETYFPPLAKWAASKGVAWGLAEVGYTSVTSSADPTWLLKTYRAMVDHGGVAMAYFSSSLNSVTNWELNTTARQNQFVEVLRPAPTLILE